MLRQLTCRLGAPHASVRVARTALFSSTSRCQEAAPTAKPDLPAAPLGSEPLKDSDFTQYLTPLYGNGWGVSVGSGKHMGGNFGILNRALDFGSRQQLSEFIKKTPQFASNETAPHAVVSRNKNDLRIFTTSIVGLTSAHLRLAIELEKEYQNFLGPALNIQQTKRKWHVANLEGLQRLVDELRPSASPSLVFPSLVMPTRAALPTPPPAPAQPAPPISDEHMATYLAPLSTHGWHITGVGSGDKRVRGHASLRRIYTFKDSASAWAFLPSVVEGVPILPTSLAGGEITLRTSDRGMELQVSLVSDLSEGAPKKYGVTLGDLRTAIELERTYIAEFTQDAAPEISNFRAPKNQAEMWDFKSLKQ